MFILFQHTHRASLRNLLALHNITVKYQFSLSKKKELKRDGSQQQQHQQQQKESLYQKLEVGIEKINC